MKLCRYNDISFFTPAKTKELCRYNDIRKKISVMLLIGFHKNEPVALNNIKMSAGIFIQLNTLYVCNICAARLR